MGFAFVNSTQACADACRTRHPDAYGGSCQYFNIWTAVVDGVRTKTTCAMVSTFSIIIWRWLIPWQYYFPAVASSATNTGQGNLAIIESAGFRRNTYVIDGGFERFPCSETFCFATEYEYWVGSSAAGGKFDATVFSWRPYAHFGNAVAILGSAYGTDTLPGTLRPRKALDTKAGQKYVIEFFHFSSYGSPAQQNATFLDVLWNGEVIVHMEPGYTPWRFYQVLVNGKGGDKLAFHGGKAPAYSFLDDIRVVLA